MGSKTPALYSAVLVLMSFIGMGSNARQDTRATRAHPNDEGQLAIAGIVGIAVLVITVIVVMAILADFSGPFFSDLGNLTENVTTANTGNSTVDGLMPTFGLLVAFVGAIGFVALALNLFDRNL